MSTASQLGPIALDPAAGLEVSLDRSAYWCLWAFVFAVPWDEVAPMLGGLTVSSWLGLLVFAAMALRIGVARRLRPPSHLHGWMLAFVAWAGLSLFWTLDWDSTVSRVGTYVQLLFLAWVMQELATTTARVTGLLQAYIFGACVCSFDTINNFFTGTTAAQLYAARGQEVWTEARYTAGSLNENDLGLMLALTIAITFYLLAQRPRKAMQLVYWIEFGAACAAILLTGSRGAFMAAAVSLVMLPLVSRRLSRLQRVLSLVGCVAALSVGIYLVPEATWQRLLSFVSDGTGTMTHRTVIWAAGLEVFRSHPVLGVGAGAFAPTVIQMIDVPYVAHNSFLSVLVELGIIGALIFLGMLANLLYSALRMPYLERCLWTVLLATWALGVSALTWEYRKATWLLFGILAAHACLRARADRTPRCNPIRVPLRRDALTQ